MRTLVIGDIHLDDNFLIFKKVLFPYLQQIVTQYKVDRILLLGDVFDCSTLSNTVLALFKQLMLIFKDFDVEIIVGNHDKIDTKISAFDILLLNDNITIIPEPTFKGSEIYLPHISNKAEFTNVFTDVNDYIAKNNFERYFIYSHNDFSEVYKFSNKFFSLVDAFESLKDNVYLINGHNHVPVFRSREKLNILNIGCAINTNYRDSADKNVFLVIDDEESDPDKIFTPILNKYSIQYFTYFVSTEDEIYDYLNSLLSHNIKHVKFKVTSPNLVIDSELRDTLMQKYNIVEINVEYDIKLEQYGEKNLDEDAVTDSTDVIDLLNTLDITFEEFYENNSVDDFEKAEILFILLDLMFEETGLDDSNKEKIITTVKKHYLNI